MAESAVRHGDAVRFDRWMDERLYGPQGFYTAAGEAGRSRGDFLTSPEVGPLFGAILARWIDQRWHELGSPSHFVVVEAGAGRGALAQAVLRSDPACTPALRYVTVERSPRLRERQAELLGERVEIAAELPDEVEVGVVVANELLDNLPFRLLDNSRGGWDEVWVRNESPVLRPLPGIVPEWLPDAAPGTRLPWCAGAAEWVADVLNLLGRGWLLAFDYGVLTTSELVGRRWLRTYVAHTRGFDPFTTQRTDITTDVPFDQLPPPTEIDRQADFLGRCGIEELVAEGRRIWLDGAGRGDLTALRARSRTVEADALADPDGLGGFLVASWRVG